MTLRGKAACVGLATAGCGEAPGRNAMELMAEAVVRALADAQIPLAKVDGLFAATAFHSMAAMSLAEHLGIRPAFSDGSNIGGSSFMAHALMAAMALDAGLINVAVIAYGSNQRTAGGFKSISEPMPFEAIYGPRNPITAYALATSRYMHEFGATREDLAEVAVAARGWANLNPEAFARGPLTVADVTGARMISDPLGKLDCCLVTDGAAAIVLTRPDRAKDGPRTPVYLLGAAMEHHHRMISAMPSLTTTAAAASGPRAFAMAGCGPRDMDTVQLYDAFTINTLLFLEDLGFCAKGEAAAFIKGGRIAPGGALPVNTNGGGLSCVHPGMYGLFVTIEAIRQIRAGAGDDEGPREAGGWIPGAKLSLAHGNGGVLSSQVTSVWGHGDTL
ncbi:acetyl-CoA acetyltransferase [Limibaculum sp. FT325]|uniref:acetyl-CoA acetyltransferase n=1 Tax=Thermohalobaculum sediminis TaxID=2939436 RepID=UPI0020BDFA63|nr:acetyl-CoA acetyltransferase [Limibaculum sediminis]MCL5775943.1 acetyl-CoA acetyltransferase [Limibaculum sediminis]